MLSAAPTLSQACGIVGSGAKESYTLSTVRNRARNFFAKINVSGPTPNILWRVALLIAFSIFAFYQLAITVKPLLARPLPVEVDDAYPYLIKAEQIRGDCFLQDCPALTTLRPQLLVPTFEDQAANERLRVYQDVFLVHLPLHSITLVLLRTLGLTYEQAYDAVSLLGKIVIVIGVAYWLVALYGVRATTFSLLLLAPIVYHGQGLSTVVPGNIALGLSLLLWGLIIQKSRLLRYTFIPLLLAIIFTHQVGRVYAGFAVALFWLTHERPLNRQSRWMLFAAVGVVAFPFLLSEVIRRPEFKFVTSQFYANPINSFNVTTEQIQDAFFPVRFWNTAFRSVGVTISLILIGATTQSPAMRKGWVYTSVLLLGLLGLGLVWTVPGRGAQLFGRAWIPTSLFLVGAIGQSLVFLFTLVVQQARQLWNSPNYFRNRVSYQKLFAFLATAALVSILILQIFPGYFAHYGHHYDLTLNNQITRYDLRLNSSQPGLVRSPVGPDSAKLLYLDRVALYYYLTYGGLDYGAVYYPAYDSTPSSQQQLTNHLSDLTHLVTRNPILAFQQLPESIVVLDDDAHLALKGLAPLNIRSLQMYVVGAGRPVDLEIEWSSAESTVTTNETIPQGASGWIDFKQDELLADSVLIKLIGTRGITIRGIRFDENQPTFWPWETGIKLTLTPSAGDPIDIEISEDVLKQELPLDIDVIDDTGYTLLAGVNH